MDRQQHYNLRSRRLNNDDEPRTAPIPLPTADCVSESEATADEPSRLFTAAVQTLLSQSRWHLIISRLRGRRGLLPDSPPTHLPQQTVVPETLLATMVTSDSVFTQFLNELGEILARTPREATLYPVPTPDQHTVDRTNCITDNRGLSGICHSYRNYFPNGQ